MDSPFILALIAPTLSGFFCLNPSNKQIMKCSYYTKSMTVKVGDYDLTKILTAIKSEHKSVIENLRVLRAKDEDAYKAKKAKTLHSFTTSGTFSDKQRLASKLEEHSGFICMDFDEIAESEFSEVKGLLLDDPYTYALFVSPSGVGLKCIVRIPPHQDDEGHKLSFNSLNDYYYDGYNQKVDKKCADVSRLCFVSYDPDLYFNPDAPVYEFIKEVETPNPKQFEVKQYDRGSDLERVMYCAKELARQGKDITAGYENWLRMAFSLANLGENGREPFHLISAQNTQYDYNKTDRQFSVCLKNLNGKVSLGSFFAYCKQEGVEWKQYKPEPRKTVYLPPPPKPKPKPTPKPSGNALYDFFPTQMRADLLDIAEALDYRPNLLCFGALAAASSQIGLTYGLELENEWKSFAALYCAGVGDASIGKTPSFEFAFAPIAEREKCIQKEVAKEKEAFRVKQFENTKKPKKDQELLDEPKDMTLISNDVTMESVSRILSENPKGFALFVDELAGWVASFNKYGGGGRGADSKKWLSIWSNQAMIVNRATKDKLYVPNSFVTVLGGIQPSALDALAENGQDTDGFLYRFLFEFGVKEEPAVWQKLKEGKAKVRSARERYFEIINRLADLCYQGETVMLKTCEGADKEWGEYFDNSERIAKKNREEGKSAENSILGKMSIYATRFALIAELLSYACGESDLSCISRESMVKGVNLAKYYEINSLHALRVIQKNKEVKLDSKPRSTSYCNWVEIFGNDAELPTGELSERVMKKHGKSERTVRRWISSELTNIGHGVWTYRVLEEK